MKVWLSFVGVWFQNTISNVMRNFYWELFVRLNIYAFLNADIIYYLDTCSALLFPKGRCSVIADAAGYGAVQCH